MAHYHGFCYRIFALRYTGGILELKKLDFRGLICQSDVRKVIFRGVIAKIGYLRPILTSRTHFWPIFKDYAMERDVKKAKTRGQIAKIVYMKRARPWILPWEL